MAEYSIEAELKANVSKFRNAIDAARNVTEKFKRESDSVEDTELNADATGFNSTVEKARQTLKAFDNIRGESNIDANIKPLQRNMNTAMGMMQAFTASKTEINVDADTSAATRKMAMLMPVKQALERAVRIPVRVNTKSVLRAFGSIGKAGSKTFSSIGTAASKAFGSAERGVQRFQKQIGRIAQFSQSLGVVMGNTFTGIGIMFSSTLVPAIASLVPAIMAVGNAIGVLGSGAVAMGAAFGIAGIAAIGFGAAALPTIQSIIDGTAEMTAENQVAMYSLEQLKTAWQGVVDAIAPDVAMGFAYALTAVESAIGQLSPMFESVAHMLQNLSEEFLNFIELSPSAESFFNYLNSNAAPILEHIIRGIGGFIEGLMNLTVAFAPLTDMMAQGFESMGQSFADFTARIQESQALQDFIDYVKTNLPTIGDIFGDVFMGIINLFTAFSDNSELIFDSLARMAEDFRQWSETIKESDGFQQFIDYVQENGPKVLSVIGEIITFIINLGIALAPLGSVMLDVADAILTWTNNMMEAHPWIGNIIAAGTLLIGALMAIVPNILLVVSAFGGFAAVGSFVSTVFSAIGTALSWLGGMFMKIITPVLNFGRTILSGLGGAIKAVLPWIARIGGFLLRFATGPVGVVMTVVLLLADIFNIGWTEIANITQKIWGALPGWITGPLESIGSAVGNVFGWIGDFVGGKSEESSQSVQNGFSSMNTSAQTQLPMMGSTVSSQFGNMFNSVDTNMFQMQNSTLTNMMGMNTTASSQLGMMNSTVGTNMSDMQMQTGMNLGLMTDQTVQNLGMMNSTVSAETGAMLQTANSNMSNMQMQTGMNLGLMTDETAQKLGTMSSTVGTNMSTMSSLTGTNLGLMSTDFSTNMSSMSTDTTSNFSDILSTANENMGQMSSGVNTDLSSMQSSFTDNLSGMSTDTASNFGDMSSTVNTEMSAMNSDVTTQFNQAQTAASRSSMQMSETTKRHFISMANAVNTSMNQLNSTVVNLMNATISYLNSINLHSTGQQIMQGLINGVESMRGSLQSTMTSIASSAASSARSALQIHSPSRLFDKYGVYTIEGFIRGIERMRNAVSRTTSDSADNISDSFRPDFIPGLSQGIKTMTNEGQKMFGASANILTNSGKPAFEQIGINLGQSFAGGLISQMQPVIAAVEDLLGFFNKAVNFRFPNNSGMGKYLNAIIEDGDYMNDFLTHIPKQFRDVAKSIGKEMSDFLDVGFQPIGQRRDKLTVARDKTEDILSSLKSVNRNARTSTQSGLTANGNVSKQPANINVRIGNSEFSTFVDDITNTQDRKNHRALRNRG